MKDKQYYLTKFDEQRKLRCREGTMFSYYAQELMDVFCDIAKEILADIATPSPCCGSAGPANFGSAPIDKRLTRDDVRVGGEYVLKSSAYRSRFLVISLATDMSPGDSYGSVVVAYKDANGEYADRWSRPMKNFLQAFEHP